MKGFFTNLAKAEEKTVIKTTKAFAILLALKKVQSEKLGFVSLRT